MRRIAQPVKMPKMVSQSHDDFERVGGRLCLDFVNTRGSHYDADAREYVDDYAGLVAWLRACDGGLDARQASRLLAAARAHPRRASEVFAKSGELRALLYRILAAISKRSIARRRARLPNGRSHPARSGAGHGATTARSSFHSGS
jgi:hypothetical protein